MLLKAFHKYFFPTEHKNIIILSVDSNRKDLNTVANTVAAEGYNILTATEAKEALYLASTHKPNLIIVDLSLPDMPSLQLFRQLKEQQDTKDIPVIVLTKHNTSQFILDAYEFGIDNYLIKPFTRKVLLKLVDEVLRDSRSASVPWA